MYTVMIGLPSLGIITRYEIHDLFTDIQFWKRSKLSLPNINGIPFARKLELTNHAGKW